MRGETEGIIVKQSANKNDVTRHRDITYSETVNHVSHRNLHSAIRADPASAAPAGT